MRSAVLGFVVAATFGFSPPVSGGEDSLVLPVQASRDNIEPAIVHTDEKEMVRKRLAELEKKFGRSPNLLIFLMDDVGWGDPGCYGGGHMAGAPTPNIDRLCRKGLMLTSCYAQPSCSPTRATIMTGRLPMRHGILRPPMYDEKGGLQGEITLAKLLSDAGYVTQAVGKWHMGENEESQPQNVGFDDFFGFLGVSDIYTEWRDPYFYPEITRSPERTKLIEKEPFNKHLVHGSKGRKLENIEEITIPVSSQLDESFAQYSLNFIREACRGNRPFFLYHCTRACHFDNYPDEKFKGKSPAKYPYKDALVQVDNILGRLLAELEATGQLDNTLVFITSDNGPEMETWPDAGYTPFRGAKGSTWEGGMRVPGIVYWPGVIAPGRISDGLFDLADLFTTCLTLAGCQDKIPTDRFIDGIDQSSFLLADKGDSDRKFVYYWQQDNFSAIRCAEYKYFRLAQEFDYRDVQSSGGFSGFNKTYSYGKFFNLYLDPKESHSFLIRKLAYGSIFEDAMARHLDTFKKYPPKIIVPH